MMNGEDPVTEVRRIREAHAAEHDFDLDRIAEDIRKGEERLRTEGWQLVTHKKPISPKVEAAAKP